MSQHHLATTRLSIRQLDRADRGQVRAFWEVGLVAVADRPYNSYLAWPAASTLLRRTRRDLVDVQVAAWHDATMVGTGWLVAPVWENTETARVDVNVRPEWARAGIGSLLMSALEQRAHDLGRRVLLGEACAPPDGDSAAVAFAFHHGFHVDQVDTRMVVDLVATRGLWTALAAEIAEHHADYQLVTAWSPVPHEPSRVQLHTVALDSAGEVVARTELFLDRATTHHAVQKATLVLPDHRGHRLGLAAKLANHRALVTRFPEVQWMVTGNAGVNAHLDTLDAQLGYRIVERCFEMRRTA